MQQTAKYEISEEFHAKLHANGIPHKNVLPGANKPYVEITLEFDEKLAASVCTLSNDHIFNFNNYTYVPKKDSNGNFLFENADFTGHISKYEVKPSSVGIDINQFVKKEILRNFQNTVNIDKCIEEFIARKMEWNIANSLASMLEEKRKKLYAEQEARELEEARIKKEQQKVQEREQEEKEKAILKEQLAWINEYGSERLKKSFEKNYKCKKLYLIERLKHDVGEYKLDYDGDIERKNRSCPSMEALLEVERIEQIEGITEAKVVWLPHGLNTPDDYENYDSGCEAIEAKFFGYYVYSKKEY